MDVFRKNIALTVLFTISVLITHFAGISVDNGNEVVDNAQQNFSHMEINGWQATDIRTSDAVLDVLKADRTIFANYAKPGALPLTLYAGYYKNLEKSKWSHAPQVCYTAQGWVMTINDKIMINSDQDRIEVNRMRIEKGNEAMLVYYWYQTNDHVFADLYKMKFSLFLQGLRHKNEKSNGNVFVRISVPISINIEHAHQQLQQFVDEFSSNFKRWFVENDIHQNTFPGTE